MAIAELSDVDLADPDRFVEAVPYDMLALLRREDPVHWQEEPDGSGFWAVMKYADIKAVHMDWETYSSERGGTSLQELTGEQLEQRKSMIDTDPPRHKKLRSLINTNFNPNAVKGHEQAVRALISEITDRALELQEMEFVSEVSAELPMAVFAEMLGAPQEDRRYLVDLGDRILGTDDPELVDPEELRKNRHLPFSSPAAGEMFEYGRALAEQRRREPRDDIVTSLVQAELDGQPLTQREFDTFFLLLATAGNETTRHTISHGLLALHDHPEQLARLKEEPELIPRATEEILRWATPVMHFRRTATRDVELGGKQIREGDKVVTWLISGNRDEDVFENPDTFDVGRRPNRHQTFGPGGVHFCIGAGLARMEIRLMFEELVPRIGSIELTGKPERLRSNFFNAIKRLPVRITPA
ncbi:MAG: cytochrome P450 [Solirubrobacterales bacterium]|nr:cytochrome P450 [Solirubrobacterales bacterium]